MFSFLRYLLLLGSLIKVFLFLHIMQEAQYAVCYI